MKPTDLTPPGCCECGCGESPALARSSWAEKGRIKGQPLRFVKGHGGHSSGPPPITELENGCWEWTGKRDQAGYGRVRRNNRDWLAHRWVYSRLVRPLAAEDILDHLCRNRACVNPEHLEAVTDAVNVRRGIGTKLSPDNVAQIRREWQEARTQMSQREFARRLAPLFDVDPYTIRSIVRGLTWGPAKVRNA